MRAMAAPCYVSLILLVLILSHISGYPSPVRGLLRKSNTCSRGRVSTVISSAFSDAPISREELSQYVGNKVEGSRGTKFARVDRIEALEKWTKEIIFWKDSISDTINSIDSSNENQESPLIGLLIELSKELLYSNIPEQALELYAAYYDILHTHHKRNNDNKKDSKKVGKNPIASKKKTPPTTTVVTTELPVISNSRLIILTTRSFIALGDIMGALKFLQASFRLGIQFDSESKSQLLCDLAYSSPKGLKAALQLRSSMLERNETIGTNACASLLRGILTHGLSPRKIDRSLLIDLAYETYYLDEEEDVNEGFRLTVVKALELAEEIMEYHVDAQKGKKKSSRSHSVVQEYLRIVFRLAAGSQGAGKDFLDWNLDVDIFSQREHQAQQAIVAVLNAMEEFNIGWSITVADVLMEECIGLDDVTACKLVATKMWEHRIECRTSTFNALLKKYASVGDGEEAYNLLADYMSTTTSCQPNSESIVVVLDACLQTQRGRFYAKQIFDELLAVEMNTEFSGRKILGNKKMNKEMWDQYFQFKIFTNESFIDTIFEMAKAGEQPDENTVLLMISAFGKTGKWKDALQLYRLMSTAEILRRAYRSQVLSDGGESLTSSDTKTHEPMNSVNSRAKISSLKELSSSVGLYLPPPSNRIVQSLLEILKEHGRVEDAIDLLNDICEKFSGKEDAFISHDLSASRILKKPIPFNISPNMPSTLTSSGKKLLDDKFVPDVTIFAIVMETCIRAHRADLAFNVFRKMERLGIQPTRRIYTALIKAFGLRGSSDDVSSALGVFDEMRKKFVPDIGGLKSIMDICMRNPTDLRQVCYVLEDLEAMDVINLEIYSKDVLMQSFPDGVSLSAALEMMENQPIPPGESTMKASLQVLNVLVQTARKDDTMSGLLEAMAFLGRIGIRPDDETMDYFRLPNDMPLPGSPNSRHINRQLLPLKDRLRSLLDIDMPDGLAPDLSLIKDDFFDDAGTQKTEPYHESGMSKYIEYRKILSRILINDEDAEANIEDYNESDSHLDTATLVLIDDTIGAKPFRSGECVLNVERSNAEVVESVHNNNSSTLRTISDQTSLKKNRNIQLSPFANELGLLSYLLDSPKDKKSTHSTTSGDKNDLSRRKEIARFLSSEERKGLRKSKQMTKGDRRQRQSNNRVKADAASK